MTAQSQDIFASLLWGQNIVNDTSKLLNTDYGKGIAPWTALFTQAQPGVQQYANLMGLNGPAGSQSALATLAQTPGYQFSLGQGNNAINAQAAATGMLGSGNQATALSNYNQGAAQQIYGQYMQGLMPYLQQQTGAAGGISSGWENLANAQAQLQETWLDAMMSAMSAAGASQDQAAMADKSMFSSLLGGGLGLLSKGLGGLFSDERLKENIEPVGELYDGLKVYRYNYLWDETPQIGVMADEVEEKYPEAVSEVGGYKMVRYDKATDYAAGLSAFLEEA